MPTQQPQSSKPFDKILARRVIHRGQTFGLSVVELYPDDVIIEPFERETANTRSVDGTLRILRQGHQSPTDWHRPGDRPTLVIE